MEPHPIDIRCYEQQELPSGQDERRAHPRLRCGGVAEIRVLPTESSASGSLLDLSVTGCRLETGVRIAAVENSVMEVRLRLKGFTLRVAGVVRHAGEHRNFGIEFLDVNERKAAQIEEMMTELRMMEGQFLSHALEPEGAEKGPR